MFFRVLANVEPKISIHLSLIDTFYSVLHACLFFAHTDGTVGVSYNRAYNSKKNVSAKSLFRVFANQGFLVLTNRTTLISRSVRYLRIMVHASDNFHLIGTD